MNLLATIEYSGGRVESEVLWRLSPAFVDFYRSVTATNTLSVTWANSAPEAGPSPQQWESTHWLWGYVENICELG